MENSFSNTNEALGFLNRIFQEDIRNVLFLASYGDHQLAQFAVKMVYNDLEGRKLDIQKQIKSMDGLIKERDEARKTLKKLEDEFNAQNVELISLRVKLSGFSSRTTVPTEKNPEKDDTFNPEDFRIVPPIDPDSHPVMDDIAFFEDGSGPDREKEEL